MSDKPEAKSALDSTPSGSPGHSLIEGTKTGAVTWHGWNKRDPGGPLPPIGSQVFFGPKPSSASAKDGPGGGR